MILLHAGIVEKPFVTKNCSGLKFLEIWLERSSQTERRLFPGLAPVLEMELIHSSPVLNVQLASKYIRFIITTLAPLRKDVFS